MSITKNDLSSMHKNKNMYEYKYIKCIKKNKI